MIKKLLSLLGLMASVNVACDANESNVDETDDTNGVTQISNGLESIVVDTLDAKDNIVVGDGTFGIVAKPAFAGRTTNIFAFNNLSVKNEIEKVELYKNGELIEVVNGSYLDVDVESDAGLHSFVAKFYDASGNEVLSKPIGVDFSGEVTDFKPFIRDFNVLQNAGNSTFMYARLDDIGDNKGIKEVRFYENGELIKTFDGVKSVFMPVVSNNEDSRVYKIEVEDILGNITQSDEIEVNFSGTPNKPNLTLLSAHPNEAGVNGFISAYVNDNGNFVNDGIEEVILFQNGEEIEKKVVENKRGRSNTPIHFYVSSENQVSNEYFIRVVNKQGESVDSKVEVINFSGEYFAPEVTWFDSSKSVGKTANIFVNAKDGFNVKDSGIAKIELYEDGKLVKESDGDKLFYEVTKEDSGLHQYSAKIVNTFGVETLSDSIDVQFQGVDNPAEIDNFNVYIDDKTGMGKVFVRANDKSNIRDGFGIDEIILYEDGKIISSVNDSSNLFADLSSREGKHVYRVEVVNNFGVKVTQELEFDYNKDKL